MVCDKTCNCFIEFHMYFVLALHQPSDPAVVAVSETRLPPHQQKNILQVCRCIIYTSLEMLSRKQVQPLDVHCLMSDPKFPHKASDSDNL